LLDFDNVKRCLRACDPNSTKAADLLCGQDFECAWTRSSTAAKPDARCMRSPLDDGLFATCLTELQPYEIHAGESFVVTGSQTGYLTDLEPDPATRECAIPPATGTDAQFVQLHQSRIPIDPAVLPSCASLPDVLSPLSPGQPNACLFSASGSDRVIHFENPLFAIGLDLPAQSPLPPDQTVLTFQVVGGGFPQSLAVGIDVQAQQPRAAVTAPDLQTVYIVDEGKQTTATGLRGQLLKLFSTSQAIDRLFIVR
jgi:hypothetical protein